MPERIENQGLKGAFKASICRVDAEGFDARVYSEVMGASSERNLAELVRHRISVLVRNSIENANKYPGHQILKRDNFRVLAPDERLPFKDIPVRYPTPAEIRLIGCELNQPDLPQEQLFTQPEERKELAGVR